MAAPARSRARRLDPADELLELVGGVTDVLGETADDFERLLRLADLDQLVDEILVRLQGPQEFHEFSARGGEFVIGALGLFLEPSPLVEQKLLLLRLEAVLLFERAQLVARVIERAGAELR